MKTLNHKTLNDVIAVYKEELIKGDIVVAYRELVKFVMRIRTELMNDKSSGFSFAGVAHGYIDYTYFYYSNDFLKANKLKPGFVLNHLDMRFEVWLLGNTRPVQKRYWQLFKDNGWIQDKTDMPEYAALEVVIMDEPDFNDLDGLAHKLKASCINTSEEVLKQLQDFEPSK